MQNEEKAVESGGEEVSLHRTVHCSTLRAVLLMMGRRSRRSSGGGEMGSWGCTWNCTMHGCMHTHTHTAVLCYNHWYLTLLYRILIILPASAHRNANTFSASSACTCIIQTCTHCLFPIFLFFYTDTHTHSHTQSRLTSLSKKEEAAKAKDQP